MSLGEDARPIVSTPPSTFELALVLVSATLITGASLDEGAPLLSRILRAFAYLAAALVAARRAGPILRSPRRSLRAFLAAYSRTALVPLGLYFLGLIVGSLHGPAPMYSLWQTFSDAVVFSFAFLCFGWLNPDLDGTVRRFLQLIAGWAGILLVGSVIAYIGNVAGWWLVNPYYHPDVRGIRLLMNGPFNHANHLAYVLMTGSLAAGTLAATVRPRSRWAWLGLCVLLALAVAPTFGRGALLGTAAGLIAILATRHRRVALALAVLAVVGASALAVAVALDSPLLDYLPKTSFAGRGELWGAALENVRRYGPLGVGSGQAESFPGLSPHNFLIEQYGEGGVLTLAGVLSWLALPIVFLRRSTLRRDLSWCVVACMAALMVHGVFWGQFLNGLRFLSLIYASLWTALATQARTPAETTATAR